MLHINKPVLSNLQMYTNYYSDKINLQLFYIISCSVTSV